MWLLICVSDRLATLSPGHWSGGDVSATKYETGAQIESFACKLWALYSIQLPIIPISYHKLFTRSLALLWLYGGLTLIRKMCSSCFSEYHSVEHHWGKIISPFQMQERLLMFTLPMSLQQVLTWLLTLACRSQWVWLAVYQIRSLSIIWVSSTYHCGLAPSCEFLK